MIGVNTNCKVCKRLAEDHAGAGGCPGRLTDYEPSETIAECKSFYKYKGLREPRCNGGNPCIACLRKYNSVQLRRWKSSLVQVA